MKYEVAFVSIVPSPYQRDLFQALAGRSELGLSVFYLEAASPDSPWPSKPLEPYYEREDFPGPAVLSDEELLGAARQRGTTTFHPASSCRMGPATDPLAVVDDKLCVHGLEALRLIDASIMPRMISANLNAATLMIAEKGSDLIRGKAAPEPANLPQ